MDDCNNNDLKNLGDLNDLDDNDDDGDEDDDDDDHDGDDDDEDDDCVVTIWYDIITTKMNVVTPNVTYIYWVPYYHTRLAGSWNQGIIAHQAARFRWPPKHQRSVGILPEIFQNVHFWQKYLTGFESI